jgi:Flp pilus assembly protein TadG
VAAVRFTSVLHFIQTINTRLRNESGQAAIEYALVLPFVILILFVLINFVFLFNYWNNEQHLASVAARFAAVGANPDASKSFKAAILAQADAQTLTDNATLCVSFPQGRAVGQPVTIDVSYVYTPFSGFPAVTLHGKATERLETNSSAIPAGPDC